MLFLSQVPAVLGVYPSLPVEPTSFPPSALTESPINQDSFCPAICSKLSKRNSLPTAIVMLSMVFTRSALKVACPANRAPVKKLVGESGPMLGLTVFLLKKSTLLLPYPPLISKLKSSAKLPFTPETNCKSVRLVGVSGLNPSGNISSTRRSFLAAARVKIPPMTRLNVRPPNV